MPAQWLVDASNVVGSRPDGWWKDRDAALVRLVGEVARWRGDGGEAGDAVTVVADGHPPAALPEGEAAGVEVVYARSRARDAADDRIVQLVAAAPDPGAVLVVTSDRRLRQRVEDLGARVEGAGSFLRRIGRAGPAPGRGTAGPA